MLPPTWDRGRRYHYIRFTAAQTRSFLNWIICNLKRCLFNAMAYYYERAVIS